MRAYVAVTDPNWFQFLRARPNLDEVNFWRPGGDRQFKAIDPGEPFLFKLPSPQNFIVGGAIYSRFYGLPISMAWTAFEEANGAPGFIQLRRAIESHRQATSSGEDFRIGCIILQSAVFLPRDRWMECQPRLTGYSPGKTFDLEREPISSFWLQVQSAMAVPASFVREAPSTMYGELQLHRPRLGQGSFRIEITRSYCEHCAVSGERALPTLDAAHILPVAEGGEHRLDNGLLLRSDIHRLFDRGYATVTPDHRFRVSRRLRDDFDNGEPYFPLDGIEISRPSRPEDWPSKEFLEWHADTVFRG